MWIIIDRFQSSVIIDEFFYIYQKNLKTSQSNFFYSVIPYLTQNFKIFIFCLMFQFIIYVQFKVT